MAIEQLGYVIVKSADIDAWDSFLVDTVGAMRAENPSDGAKHYRIDSRPFRFRIEEGDSDYLAAAAYRISSQDDLHSLRERIIASGQQCEDGSPEEARARGVAQFIKVTDPAGNSLEFYCGDSADDVAFVSEQGVAGFVTGDLGMGHAVFAAPDFDASCTFYRDVLGFHETDMPHFKMSDEPEDTGFRIAFMHADNGRHHSVALGQHPPTPARCVHLMLEMTSVDDVGRAHDRMRKADVWESATLGRHCNDKVLSFYMRTPSGFDLEIGVGGLVIDPDAWEVTAIDKISEWGHVWAWQR